MAGWKDFLGIAEKLAPAVASIAGSQFAGLALSTVFNALGITPKSTDPEQQKKELAEAWTGSQEQLLALRKAENDFRIKMAELGFANDKDLEALAVQDRANARAANRSAGLDTSFSGSLHHVRLFRLHRDADEVRGAAIVTSHRVFRSGHARHCVYRGGDLLLWFIPRLGRED